MSPYRSTVIREVETDLHASRARGMLKHEGQTYTQAKASRARWRRLTLRWAGWALFVLVAFTVAVHLVTR